MVAEIFERAITGITVAGGDAIFGGRYYF